MYYKEYARETVKKKTERNSNFFFLSLEWNSLKVSVALDDGGRTNFYLWSWKFFTRTFFHQLFWVSSTHHLVGKLINVFGNSKSVLAGAVDGNN
jgi:hypothetical protein